MTMNGVTKVMMSIGIMTAFSSSILSIIPTAAGINITGIRSRSRFPVTSTSESLMIPLHRPPRRMNRPYTPAGTGLSLIHIYGDKIRIETAAFIASNFYTSDMSNCICGGSGSDIASLYISDHKESLVLAVFDRAGIYFKTCLLYTSRGKKKDPDLFG